MIKKLNFLHKQMEFTFLLSPFVNFAYPKSPLYKFLILSSKPSSQYHQQQNPSSCEHHACFVCKMKSARFSSYRKLTKRMSDRDEAGRATHFTEVETDLSSKENYFMLLPLFSVFNNAFQLLSSKWSK